MPALLKRLDLRGVPGDLAALLPRPELSGAGPVAAVRAILAEVRDGGDAAVRACSQRYDGVALDGLRVGADELGAALAGLAPLLREALEGARDAIIAFHRTQLHPDTCHEREGIVVRELQRPDNDGSVNAPTLAAAALAGVDEVYRIGGAQAIGAMAYGTETIRPVDVIVGPGNTWVSIAKREVAQEGLVGVPSAFAGPSEVLVVADDATSVDCAAIDLIVQAEHGPDGLAWLVTWSEEAADRISEAVARLTALSPRRSEIESTLERGGYAVLVEGPERAMEVANAIAPEHLELMTADPEALVPSVRNAGAVFCGAYAPASVGDYTAGPSHVLPTYRSARFASALGVDDFVKQIHVVSLDRQALARIAPRVAAIAEAEGLAAHAASVRMRSAI